MPLLPRRRLSLIVCAASLLVAPLFGCHRTSDAAPPAAAPRPAAAPAPLPAETVFTWIDRFLPQFNGELERSTGGKTAYGRADIAQRVGKAQSESGWRPVENAKLEGMTASAMTTLGGKAYRCVIAPLAQPNDGPLISIRFTLENPDRQPIETDIGALLTLVAGHFGDPTLTYSDADGAEWHFARGKLAMTLENGDDFDDQPSSVIFELGPLKTALPKSNDDVRDHD
jgi:hypothetical protein